MPHRLSLAVALLGVAAACTDTPVAPAGPTLVATVVRGPTVSCFAPTGCPDEPFAATFDLTRGSTRVAVVRSDGQGRFRVSLPAGHYRLTPRADAPLYQPERQGQDVTLAGDSVTTMTLSFDTGIRTLTPTPDAARATAHQSR